MVTTAPSILTGRKITTEVPRDLHHAGEVRTFRVRATTTKIVVEWDEDPIEFTMTPGILEVATGWIAPLGNLLVNIEEICEDVNVDEIIRLITRLATES